MGGNARGKNYNMHSVIELYASGMKSAEITNRLKINSVQNLRHAIEHHKREMERTERIISEITEEIKPDKRRKMKSWKMKQNRKRLQKGKS